MFECFAFASTISAVDPVATLAIFQAVKVSACDLLDVALFDSSVSFFVEWPPKCSC